MQPRTCCIPTPIRQARAAFAISRFPHQTGRRDNAIVYDGKVPSWMRDQGHEVTSIGKLQFRSGEDDNGFSEELLPMHILNGKGSVHIPLRGHDVGQVNHGQWELYMERLGVGTAPRQAFDREISETALFDNIGLFQNMVVGLFIGAYASRLQYDDVWMMLAFGALAYILSQLGFPLGSLVLGLVPGKLFDEFLRIALIASGGSFAPLYERPIVLGLSILLVIFFIASTSAVRQLLGRLIRIPAKAGAGQD